MSKAKSKSVKGAGGPWLNGAFIYDRSMEERDGVISAIRIVDVVRIEPVPDPLPKGFVLGTSLHLVVMFKSGDFKGNWTTISIGSALPGKGRRCSRCRWSSKATTRAATTSECKCTSSGTVKVFTGSTCILARNW